MNKPTRRPRPVWCVTLVALILVGLVFAVLQIPSGNRLKPYRISTAICDARSLTDLTIDQTLMLINEQYPLEETFSPTIGEYQDSDVWMNESLHDAYRALAKDVRSETGDTLYISSAARDRDKQIELYEDDPSVAQKPRCSEHEAGLALDVYVEGYAGMGFIKSEAGRFVNTRCEEYGFIIRYPLLGEGKTGIPYEPWHIRYVGIPHAKLITRFNMTLEEYIESLSPNAFYYIDGYILSRQPLKDGKLDIPVDCHDIRISPDNTGYYIITGKVDAS